jgi:hypothetical protein
MKAYNEKPSFSVFKSNDVSQKKKIDVLFNVYDKLGEFASLVYMKKVPFNKEAYLSGVDIAARNSVMPIMKFIILILDRFFYFLEMTV